MMSQLGLPVGFDSTKGKQVAGNDAGAVKVKSTREYRQYMNRRGGFNRPLDAEKSKKRIHILKELILKSSEQYLATNFESNCFLLLISSEAKS